MLFCMGVQSRLRGRRHQSRRDCEERSVLFSNLLGVGRRRRLAHCGMLLLIATVFVPTLASVANANQPVSLVVSAGLRYLAPDRAELRWESNLEGVASVAYGADRKLGTIRESSETGSSHAVMLDGLKPNQPLVYRVAVRHDGKRYFSPFFSVEAGVNYSVQRIAETDAAPAGLDQALQGMHQLGGVAIVSESLVASWARPIAEESQLSVISACEDEDSLRRIRAHWYDEGVYGIRLSAQLRPDVPNEIATMVVADRESLSQAAKWLSPSGVIVCVSNSNPTDDASPLPTDWIEWESIEAGVWLGRQDRLESLAVWGHQYGSTSNASYSGESLDGIDETDELAIRWLGRPGADFGIDRNPRMPAPLAVGGRLFHQGMNRMMAIDAFNGAILWTLEIPDLRRVNIPRDSANWCADGERVYAITRDRLWVIDAASGEMLHTLLHPDSAEDGHEWGYVAVTDRSVVGTSVKAGSSYEQYWDKASWYDGLDDKATAKVCGDGIYVYDKTYGDLKWSREVDAVVQSTITIQDNRMYFVEVEDSSLGDLKNGKLRDDQIWPNASVVCVDLESGKQLWKEKAPDVGGQQVVTFGIADDSQFILETSSDGKFHLTSFAKDAGDKQWTRSVDWPSDNHGAHMQHAVSMNGRIYLQPHIIDASDGTVIQSGTLGKRRGCATPIGAGGSIIYRGGSGPVSLWSLEKEKPTNFARLRPSCWLSTIPAQGMLFSPEAGGGCSCGGWMECSIGFAPKRISESGSQGE